MKSMLGYLAMFGLLMENFPFDLYFFKDSCRIPTEKPKQKYFFESGKGYRNPEISSKFSYPNKTIPGNRDSRISLVGKEIKAKRALEQKTTNDKPFK